MISRNEFIDVTKSMGGAALVKKSDIIAVSEIFSPSGTDPEVRLILSSGEDMFIADTYSSFINKLFAL